MNILLVCTGNTCRSQMAEGIMNWLAKDKSLDIIVKSAGIFALDGGQIASNSIEALKELNIDISQYRSKAISEDLVNEADIILTMSKGHKENLKLNFPEISERVFLLNEYAFGLEKDVADPFGGSKLDYDKARDEIYEAIESIIDNWDK